MQLNSSLIGTKWPPVHLQEWSWACHCKGARPFLESRADLLLLLLLLLLLESRAEVSDGLWVSDTGFNKLQTLRMKILHCYQLGVL
jgi:hypothetical protein